MADNTERQNKVSVTDAGPCRKKIEIEIPAETVAEQLGTSMDTLSAEAELPGFRKGRAPRRLVEKKFGDSIRREAKNALVAQAYSKAIEDHKLKVVGDPTSEMLEKIELLDGKALKFEIDVEVLPTFDLPALDGIDIRKPTMEVSDAMVQAEVDRVLLNEGSLNSKDKPVAGDYLTGHAVMKDAGGTVLIDIQDAVVQIPPKDKEGKGMILGVMVEDFAKQLGTPAAGESATIKTTGPENHENEAIRGKPLTISFHVKRADEIVPASMDDVLARYGMQFNDELRSAVRTRMEQRVAVDQQSLMRQQVARHLVDNTTMELPQRVTAQQAARTLQRASMEMMYRGMDQAKIEETLATMRSSASDGAVRELKLFFILDKVAEKLNVEVTEAEMNGRIAQIAISRGERPEKLRQQIIASNQAGTIFSQIREHKVMDAILAKSKITEMPADEFNKHFAGKTGVESMGDDKPAAKSKQK
jgi:trigger factor